MLHWLFGTRLEVPTKLVPVDVLLALLVVAVVALPLRRGRRRQTLVALAVAIGAGLVGLLVCWIVGDVLNEFGTQLTGVTRMWVAFAFAGVGLAVARVVTGPGFWVRTLAVVLAPVALLAAALAINTDYAAYPTLNALFQENPYPALALRGEHPAVASATVTAAADWHAPATMPAHGIVGYVHIPAPESGFPARAAVVYLPPAARTAHPPVLPVIVSLSGQPGTPSDMFLAGHLAAVLDGYASAHHGLAPIVVSADQLAVPGHNPMCVDSEVGRSGTYITRDVPNWITSHLDVPAPGRSWGLVGFSQGATCTTQFLAGDPDVFAAGLAISSERAPQDRTPENSADEAFGGSLARWRAAAPGAVMRAHGPYPGHLLLLTSGQADGDFTRTAAVLARQARAAGMPVRRAVAPDSGHDWNTVFWSLRTQLPTEADFLARGTGKGTGTGAGTDGGAAGG